MKRPSFQWYPKDYLTDLNVEVMTLEEQGAYRRLMDYEWLHQGLPNDTVALAKMCRITEARFKKLWPAIEPCFKLNRSGSILVHPRLASERRKQDLHKAAKRNAGKKGAEARWGDSPEAAETQDDDSIAIDVPMAKNGSSSSSASASASSTAVYPPAEGDARTREASELTESDRRGDDASELAVWLGDDHADVVERFVEAVGADARTLTSIFRTFGPKGTQGERILAKLNADEQRSAMAASLEALIGERQAYRQNFFRAILASNVSALVGEKPEGGNDPGRINPSTFDDDLDKEMLRQTGGIPGRGSS